MKHVLDTTRILEDEDKGIPYYRRCVMPYVDMCGPLEDMTAEFPEEEFVTGFYDAGGDQILVLEPFQKVMDSWMLYLEESMHHPIKFSSQ